MQTPFPLGRERYHDPRSLSYPVLATDVVVRSKAWRRYGSVLDQGSLGSCTGNAAAHGLNSSPFHVTATPCFKETDAIAFYSLATSLDAFPDTYPPVDSGSSGVGVSKAVQSLGHITAYRWSFGFDHFLQALMQGPVLCGTNWHQNMFYPDSDGLVHPVGDIAGGHEYLANGVNVTSKLIRFQNSWSSLWGVSGHFYMTFDDFTALLNEGGDAVLFVK